MCAHAAKFVSKGGSGSSLGERLISPINPWNPCPPRAEGHIVHFSTERETEK